jgi:hypothetical protein
MLELLEKDAKKKRHIEDERHLEILTKKILKVWYLDNLLSKKVLIKKTVCRF